MDPTSPPCPQDRAKRSGVGHQAEKKQQVTNCSQHFRFKCHVLLEISSWIPPPATGKGAEAISSNQKVKAEVCHVSIRLIAAVISQLQSQFQQKDWECLTGGLLTAPG